MPRPLEIDPDAWCAFCGDPLPEVEERDPRQKYCCKWCCDQAYEARTYTEAPLRQGACAECGAEFWTYWAAHRFCSQKCYQRDYRRHFPQPYCPVSYDPRPCIECGQAFTPKRKDTIYCGKSCRNKVAGRKRYGQAKS
jgi:hypothetical protein